jgi:hypothetical protein
MTAPVSPRKIVEPGRRFVKRDEIEDMYCEEGLGVTEQTSCNAKKPP